MNMKNLPTLVTATSYENLIAQKTALQLQSNMKPVLLPNPTKEIFDEVKKPITVKVEYKSFDYVEPKPKEKEPAPLTSMQKQVAELMKQFTLANKTHDTKIAELQATIEALAPKHETVEPSSEALASGISKPNPPEKAEDKPAETPPAETSEQPAEDSKPEETAEQPAAEEPKPEDTTETPADTTTPPAEETKPAETTETPEQPAAEPADPAPAEGGGK